jgi:hypothetical protein
VCWSLQTKERSLEKLSAQLLACSPVVEVVRDERLSAAVAQRHLCNSIVM